MNLGDILCQDEPDKKAPAASGMTDAKSIGDGSEWPIPVIDPCILLLKLLLFFMLVHVIINSY